MKRIENCWLSLQNLKRFRMIHQTFPHKTIDQFFIRYRNKCPKEYSNVYKISLTTKLLMTFAATWLCEHTNCKKVIGTCIVSCPKLLVVQLMRFAYVAGQQVRNSSKCSTQYGDRFIAMLYNEHSDGVPIALSDCPWWTFCPLRALHYVGDYNGNNYIHLNDHTVKEMSVFDFAKLASSAGYFFMKE